MKFYSEQQVKLALKQMLEWHEYDVQPSTDAMSDDFWELLGCTEDMKDVEVSFSIPTENEDATVKCIRDMIRIVRGEV